MSRFAPHRAFDRFQLCVTRDFGKLGLESVMHPEDTRASLIADIVSGQTDRVVSVIEFNAAEGIATDITADIRDEVEQTILARAIAAE
jgi:hypothetical protein